MKPDSIRENVGSTKLYGVKMKIVKLPFMAALAGIISAGASAAEKQSVGGTISPDSPTTHFVFAGKPIVSISQHGNLTRFEGPTGYDHIGVGAFSEGYILCYGSSRAYDTGSEEEGFLAGTFSCNSAKTSCTVTRKTSDGRLELRQVIKKNATDRSTTIAMRLRNLTGSSISGVVLRRQADPDVDTGGSLGTGDFTNWFGSSERDSAFAWNPPDKSGEGHAVVISSIGTVPETRNPG
jgi:hypothetical protein